MNNNLLSAISHSRNIDTCYPWSIADRVLEKPYIGQCAVTALLIHELLWGELLYDTKNNHCRNRLPDGTEIDLTKQQFENHSTIICDEIRTRDILFEKWLKSDLLKRYILFKTRVLEKLKDDEFSTI